MTDEYKGYNDLERNVISQKEKKYVDGDIHSNTIEGFWSEVKRAFHGTHHWYSKKWLPLPSHPNMLELLYGCGQFNYLCFGHFVWKFQVYLSTHFAFSFNLNYVVKILVT